MAAEQPSLIRINLLPPERLPQKGQWLAKAAVLVVMALVTVGCVLASVVVNALVIAGQSSIKRADREIALLKPQLAMVEELEQKQANLRQKQKIIDELVVHRVEWSSKLNLISDLLPDDIWLEKIYMKTKSRKEKIKPEKGSKSKSKAASARKKFKTVYTDYLYIDGVTHKVSQDIRLVGMLVNRLESDQGFMSDDFVHVEHVHSERGPYVERDTESPEVWRFEIECQLKARESIEEDG